MDNTYLKVSAQFFVNKFKEQRIFLGLIKRMEAQGASAIQIREAIERELGVKRNKSSIPETYNL